MNRIQCAITLLVVAGFMISDSQPQFVWRDDDVKVTQVVGGRSPAVLEVKPLKHGSDLTLMVTLTNGSHQPVKVPPMNLDSVHFRFWKRSSEDFVIPGYRFVTQEGLLPSEIVILPPGNSLVAHFTVEEFFLKTSTRNARNLKVEVNRYVSLADKDDPEKLDFESDWVPLPK